MLGKTIKILDRPKAIQQNNTQKIIAARMHPWELAVASFGGF